MESGFFFSATLETVGLSLEFSVGMEEGYEQEDMVYDVPVSLQEVSFHLYHPALLRLHFSSGPTTFVADGFNTNTGPLPWLPRNAIEIRMTPDKNSDHVLLFPDLSCQGTPGVSSSAR